MALLPSKARVSRDLVTFRDRANRLFDEFFEKGWDLLPGAREGEWMPALDVSETEDAVVVRAELPGVEASQIDVSISGDTLTIKGEKKTETKEQGKHYRRLERSYGTFCRLITLPATVETADIKASYDKGVLEVVLPKKEEARAKTINIEVK